VTGSGAARPVAPGSSRATPDIPARHRSLDGSPGSARYLERGSPVTVLVRWGRPGPPAPVPWLTWHRPPRRAPRSVLVRRAGGEVVVRPFRGLRRPPG
jgi:acetyl esterase